MKSNTLVSRFLELVTGSKVVYYTELKENKKNPKFQKLLQVVIETEQTRVKQFRFAIFIIVIAFIFVIVKFL